MVGQESAPRTSWAFLPIIESYSRFVCNKCIATSNKCITTSNKKLLVAMHLLLIVMHLFLVAMHLLLIGFSGFWIPGGRAELQ